VFRAYGPESATFQRRWSRVFAGASIITPIWLGIVVGALTQGRIDPAADGFVALYVSPWFTPFAVAVGLFGLALFAYLAAVYLTVSAGDPAVIDVFRWRAIGAGLVVFALAIAVFVLAIDAPHVQAALTRSRWSWPLHAITGAAALATFALLWTRRFWWARVTAAIQVAAILWGWALAQYPYLIRPDVAMHSAAAEPRILTTLLWILAAGALILVPSLVYLYRVFAPEVPRHGH
jgi:cytochrome d ubiquinol oxidase subunit II